MEKKIQKALKNYYKAQADLVKIRDDSFPVGTMVLCGMTGITGTIESGSMYADQVVINGFHASFSLLRTIGSANDE